MARFAIAGPDIVHETIDGETVIVNLSNGNYYGLQGSAASIWGLVESGCPADDMQAVLTVRFESTDGAIAADLERFLAELEREGLVVKDSETRSESTPLSSSEDRQPWETPVLEAHQDMQDLLLLDPIHEVDDEKGWPNAPDTPADQ